MSPAVVPDKLLILLVPLPISIPWLVSVFSPVPPLATGNTLVTFEPRSMAPANIPFVILPVPTAATPVLDKLISPVMDCADAALDPFPIQILPSVNAVPAGLVDETVCVVIEVIRPFVSTVIIGIALALPKSPATTPLFANVALIAPVPEPVISPLNVMV